MEGGWGEMDGGREEVGGRNTIADALLQFAYGEGGEVEVVEDDVLCGAVGEGLDDADGECRGRIGGYCCQFSSSIHLHLHLHPS